LILAVPGQRRLVTHLRPEARRRTIAQVPCIVPISDLADINNVYGYCAAQMGIQAFRQCGQDLSRETIMLQAASLDMQLPVFHAGIRYHTTATDYLGIKRLRLQRFDGKAWVPFGEPVAA
jgi:branched-chain amino acid transport system substrate-binding protein